MYGLVNFDVRFGKNILKFTNLCALKRTLSIRCTQLDLFLNCCGKKKKKKKKKKKRTFAGQKKYPTQKSATLEIQMAFSIL